MKACLFSRIVCCILFTITNFSPSHDRRNGFPGHFVASFGRRNPRSSPVRSTPTSSKIPAIFLICIISALILIIGMGLMATYTGYVIGQFKLRHPYVHSMGDAGEVLFAPLGMAVFGREFLGAAQLMVIIFIMGSHILTFTVMMNTLTEHGTCSIVFGVVGLVVSFVFSLPRTLRNVSWFSFGSFGSIIAGKQCSGDLLRGIR